MIPTLLVLTLLTFGAIAAWQESGFDAALRLVAQGRYPAALEAAAREEDPLRRAQARVYVRHLAGDLPGALTDAHEGLELAPDDVWLLEQGAFVAVSLHEGEVAEHLATRLVEALARLEDEGGAGTEALIQAEELLAEAQSLRASESARQDALGRARTASLVILTGSILLAALLGFTPRSGTA